jgi:hypothetical protein
MNITHWLNKAKEAHGDKFDYSLSVYNGMLKYIIIICPVHGRFNQKAYSHVGKQKCGCPKCGLGNNSKIEKHWLDSLRINEKYRQYCIVIKNKRLFVDGFDPTSNTVYEFYGDLWHGNPTKYFKDDINIFTNTSFGELYSNTLKREQKLKHAGYNVVSIWESEYKNLLKVTVHDI